MSDNDTYHIGYLEDGVFWLTASSEVPDAAAAARHLGDGWHVVEEVWLGPTGHWVNHKDAEWAECAPNSPGARPGWRLVDSEALEILEGGDWRPNPHHVSAQSAGGGA